MSTLRLNNKARFSTSLVLVMALGSAALMVAADIDKIRLDPGNITVNAGDTITLVVDVQDAAEDTVTTVSSNQDIEIQIQLMDDVDEGPLGGWLSAGNEVTDTLTVTLISPVLFPSGVETAIIRRASSGSDTMFFRVRRVGGTHPATSAANDWQNSNNHFTVLPGAADKLLILVPGLTQSPGEAASTPGNGYAGSPSIVARQPFELTVRLVDQFWNSVTAPTPLTATFGPDEDVRYSLNTTNVISGVGSLNGVSVDVPESNRTLTTTAGGYLGTVVVTAAGPPVSEVFPYPNPFTPGGGNLMRFQFRLDGAKPVTLKIVDVFGQEVFRRSVQGQNGINPPVGQPDPFAWDGRNENGLTVAAGMYYVLLDVDGSITSKKKIGVKK